MSTLTSANSVLMLAVGGVFPVAQQIQGFATDDAFTADAVTPVETRMGVDGKLSGGYTPYPTVLQITLQADSPSIAIFEAWGAAQNVAREVFTSDATVSIPSVGSKYALTKGFLTNFTPMPPNRKILEPQTYTITFESCTPSPI
ncbi:phage tail fiber protein [Bordetella genomosp. 11]|uniref:Phage tail protein n=1 Tax=Bordetella genomosp. 11 TaxID=1416808 RepID=A0A261UED5_9BORD|nr:hypothetical protein [Bordetella genomosp. 11]OZI59945.1 hypothetical protein CAL28_10695 [Bordetella genomosp. 11]